jgi:hypothetical protein
VAVPREAEGEVGHSPDYPPKTLPPPKKSAEPPRPEDGNPGPLMGGRALRRGSRTPRSGKQGAVSCGTDTDQEDVGADPLKGG